MGRYFRPSPVNSPWLASINKTFVNCLYSYKTLDSVFGKQMNSYFSSVQVMRDKVGK